MSPRREPAEPAQNELVVDNPRALRALAHPARSLTIDLLYEGAVMTATELASHTGLSASAMSYHLRALERWGLVRRAHASGDERERPWMRTAARLSWSGVAASRSTNDALHGAYLDRLGRELKRATGAGKDTEPTLLRGTRWLTEQELDELNRAVSERLSAAGAGRTAKLRPAGSRRVTYYYVAVPGE
jgi:DNA-binding transcriptional ArsR family regulator